MRRILIVAVLLLFVGCMKPAETGIKTKDLVPHFRVINMAPWVYCEAYFTYESDPYGHRADLESNTLVTCNDELMTEHSSYHSTFVPYVAGSKYVITVLRPVDGSTLSAVLEAD